MTVLVALTAVAMLAAPWIARLYAIDTTAADRDAQLEVMTFLIRAFLPQMCFYGLTALASARLNAHGRFAVAAFAPVLNNVVVVAALLAFVRLAEGPQSQWQSVEQIRDDRGLLLLLGLGTTAGIAATGLALLPALAHAGARLAFVLEWRHAAVRTVLRLSGWTVGYVVANQLALLFVLVLAKTGDPGTVSAYQYAFIFFQLPHGLFAVSIMTTTTPELARRAAVGDVTGLRSDLARGLRLLLFVIIPSAVALAVLAHPAVNILARRNGAFDASDAAITADTVQVLALALVPFSVYLYLLRAFYARQDTRTPFVLNTFENACNVALAAALFPVLGVQGLAYAYGGAYAIATVITLATVERRLGCRVMDAATGATALRAAVGAAAFAIVAAPLAGAIGSATAGRALAASAAAAIAGSLAFVAAVTATGGGELRAVITTIRSRGARPAGV
jgi:putative peptidoglycan lipid II flippase